MWKLHYVFRNAKYFEYFWLHLVLSKKLFYPPRLSYRPSICDCICECMHTFLCLKTSSNFCRWITKSTYLPIQKFSGMFQGESVQPQMVNLKFHWIRKITNKSFYNSIMMKIFSVSPKAVMCVKKEQICHILAVHHLNSQDEFCPFLPKKYGVHPWHPQFRHPWYYKGSWCNTLIKLL